MTIITALVSGDNVWMAADSFCEQGNQVWESSGKLFSRQVERFVTDDRLPNMVSKPETVLVGCSGRAAIASMVRYDLNWPDLPLYLDGCDEWAHKVARVWYDLCMQRRHVLDEEWDPRGAFLLAWRGYLWEISADLALPIEDYNSIGSGALVAQGVLYAAAQTGVDTPDLGQGGSVPSISHYNPKALVELAAQAACQHASGCRGPITVLST